MTGTEEQPESGTGPEASTDEHGVASTEAQNQSGSITSSTSAAQDGAGTVTGNEATPIQAQPEPEVGAASVIPPGEPEGPDQDDLNVRKGDGEKSQGSAEESDSSVNGRSSGEVVAATNSNGDGPASLIFPAPRTSSPKTEHEELSNDLLRSRVENLENKRFDNRAQRYLAMGVFFGGAVLTVISPFASLAVGAAAARWRAINRRELREVELESRITELEISKSAE